MPAKEAAKGAVSTAPFVFKFRSWGCGGIFGSFFGAEPLKRWIWGAGRYSVAYEGPKDPSPPAGLVRRVLSARRPALLPGHL